MARFVDGPVRVSVPATSANLGPGFDALGVALSLRDELEAEVAPDGLRVEVTGEGAEDVPLDDSHLVVRAMHAGFDAMGACPPGLVLRCHNAIPHCRGLGSSSAAIVAGVALARALVAGGDLLLDDEAIFELASALEGHPDNVAPALFGGFNIAGRDRDGFFAVRSAVDPRVSAVVFVPPYSLSTDLARTLLPAQVPHAEAAANAGRAALLVASLAGRPELLLRATEDLLHQSYRASAMPDSLALVGSLREQGHAAVVSGAGPTVLVFTDRPVRPVRGADGCALLEECPPEWRAHHLELDSRGIVVSR